MSSSAQSQNERMLGDAASGGQHIVLVGFMGAGKSAVGGLLAERLRVPFVDLDDVIVERTGMSIHDLFREAGEVGFRAQERAALRDVLYGYETPIVLASGGGTFADETMRELIRRAGTSVYLEASVPTLVERIASGEARRKRPLLEGPDPAATIERLLSQRRVSYEQADHTVRTDEATLERVIDQVISLLRVERRGLQRRSDVGKAPVGEAVWAAPGGQEAFDAPVDVVSSAFTYRVEFHEKSGPWLAEQITTICGAKRIALISDHTVAALHAQPLVDSLRRTGRAVCVHTFVPGEESKTLAIAERLYDELLESGLDRDDAIVALGGGVVGDMAGFVASTFLRGIAHVHVPTTTLAAVDASVGGKTGVNTHRGKNLVGTFYPPRGVLIAVAHLATQDRAAHAAGLIEALKMAATMDVDLFDGLMHDAAKILAFEPEPLLLALRRSVQLKSQVVSRDERDSGDRLILNFGHTIGHAIETGEHYSLPHGHAVGLGMLAECEWAESEGLCEGVVNQIASGLEALEAPTDWRARAIDLDAMGIDKKRRGNMVRLPYPPMLGRCEIKAVPLAALAEFVRQRRAS